MKAKEIEKYLSDLDNLKDTGFFKGRDIKDYVFHHKEMSFDEFISKGREIIRQSWYAKKNKI